MSLAREFHEAVGQPAPASPTVPDSDLTAFRLRLIREEYEEARVEFTRLLVALRAPHGNADAIVAAMQSLVKEVCDLRYVVEGTLVAFGVDPDAYEEVHRSNMSKFSGGVLRRPDGKIMKGPDYTPVDPDKMFPPIVDGTCEEPDQ